MRFVQGFAGRFCSKAVHTVERLDAGLRQFKTGGAGFLSMDRFVGRAPPKLWFAICFPIDLRAWIPSPAMLLHNTLLRCLDRWELLNCMRFLRAKPFGNQHLYFLCILDDSPNHLLMRRARFEVMMFDWRWLVDTYALHRKSQLT